MPEAKDIQERFKQQQYFMDRMFEAKTFAAVVSDSGRDSRWRSLIIVLAWWPMVVSFQRASLA